MTSDRDKGIGIKGWLSGQKPQPKSREAKPEPLALDRHRVAVLPFSNISPDPKDEYFADGMTEELVSALYKVPGLSVISRTSVMQYKNQTKHVSDIGRELNVGTLLEGSVRKAGNRIRIAAQLIDANTDNHLWAESYDRNLEDVFEVQSEIAQNVAISLRIQLLERDKERIEQASTKDPEAYTLYLKGRFHSERTTEEEYMAALGYFERAVQRDPEYALAYVGMASVYYSLGFSEFMPSKEAYAKTEKLARKALELDETLAEAHLALAIALRGAWNFEGEAREIERALELNQNLAKAHLTAAFSPGGRLFENYFEKTLLEAEKALELDPLSSSTWNSAATAFLYGGHVDRAVELYKKVLEMDPANASATGNLGLCYVRKGMYDIGIAEIKKAIGMSAGFDTMNQSDLTYALSKAGRLDEARNVLSELIRYHEEHGRGATAVAYAYASVGDRQKALEWLETAYMEHSGYLTSARADFAFEDMRSDPRYQAFLKKMGLIRSV